MYEIVMPQLSDSMEEGKLISWKVTVGQEVKEGDIIAEVESDKAIMEIQSFKAGIVKEIEVPEGEVAAVGTVIAKVALNASDRNATDKKEAEKKNVKKAAKVNAPESIKKPKIETKVHSRSEPEMQHRSKDVKNGISPKARARAASFGMDEDEVLHHSAKKLLHANDVTHYIQEHYFTPKALQLLNAYQLDMALFRLDHKVDSAEVEAYIHQNELPLPQPLTSMQKAIIANVTASAEKPVFHIYEEIDATLFEEHKEYSITVLLIHIFAKVMMRHKAFRSRLYNEAVSVFPNASVSLAVANEKNLYMPVVKDANTLSLDEIAEVLSAFRTKLQTRSFAADDMQGSSFGISNLGMLDVERFDAMINKEDAAMAAIGSIKEGKISVTLTADHRLINGYEAALFMADVKKEAKNRLNFKNPDERNR